jgi:hypothetical protein
MHKAIIWRDFVRNYHSLVSGTEPECPMITAEAVADIQKDYLILKETLENKTWELEAYRKEFLSAAESICLVAELSAKLAGIPTQRLTDTESWVATYEENWRRGNIESELKEMTGFIRACQAM